MIQKFGWLVVIVVGLGCAGRGIRTAGDWAITETRIETMGRVTGLLYADRVREKHGLDSEKGVMLARTGRTLNASAAILATDRVPPDEAWAEVMGFLCDTLDVSTERELVVAEGIALMKELAGQVEQNSRARLWLALFLQSASHAILEVYEDEFIGRTNHGDSTGDPVGDS
jgi:hypothetical protein